MEQKKLVQYFWQVTYAHTIAYTIAGVFAMTVMNYEELFVTVFANSFMRPTDEPIVFLGQSLQIFRGLLIALFLLPLRKTFFEEKHGLIKLGIITIGLSYLSTFGPGIGSFDGYIHLTIPFKYQLLGIPELLLYVLFFIGILHISQKYAHKKIITILSIIIVALIIFMSIYGFMMAIK